MGLEKPSYVFRFNTDSNGNPITIQVNNEEKMVSPINNTITLDQIPDENSRLVVINKDNSIELTEVFNMDELSDDTYYTDYLNGVLHTTSTHGGKAKVVSYGGKGLVYISARRVFDEDTLGDSVLKTLQDVINEAKKAIALISTLGQADEIIKKLEKTIVDGNILNTDLKSNISIGTPLNISLKDLVPRAETIEPKLKIQNTEANRINGLLTTNNAEANRINPILQNTIASAVDLDNKISSTGAKKVQVTSPMWGALQSDNKYHYILQHNLASQALNIDIYETTQNGLAFSTIQGYIKDNNNIELISDEVLELTVVITARFYGGQIPSLISFNTDNLTEGNNKYVQTRSYDLTASQFTLVDGLYEATINHNLNRTLFSNKVAFVNGKEIVVGFDEISNTQIKIINTVAENVRVVLQYNGGM